MKKTIMCMLLLSALAAAATNCVLRIHVLEPQGWRQYSSQDNVTVRFVVYNVSADDNVSTDSTSKIYPVDQHVNITLQNGTAYAPTAFPAGDKYQLFLNFSDKVEGVKNYSIFANASGCTNASKAMGYYLTKKFAIDPRLPEYDLVLVPFAALAALLMTRRQSKTNACL